MQQDVPIIELTGTPLERGLQHGERLADQIAGLSDLEAKSLCDASGLDLKALSAIMGRYLPLTREYSPELVEEMEGIAEGARLPLLRIFMLNAFLELYQLWLPKMRARIIGGCTTLGFPKEATNDGLVYIAQNLDLHRHFEDYPVVFRLHASDGSVALVYSFAGILGCAGLNSYGIAAVFNLLLAEGGRPGVPYPVALREALSQPTLGDAIGSVVGAHRASGMNYLLADKDVLIDIETTAARSAFLYASGGPVFHTNHYVSEELRPLDLMPELISMKRQKANTYLRYARLKGLFDTMRTSQRVGSEDLIRALCDHAGHPLGICHHSYELWPSGTGKTIASIVMIPGKGEMSWTNGPPCSSPFNRVKITIGN